MHFRDFIYMLFFLFEDNSIQASLMGNLYYIESCTKYYICKGTKDQTISRIKKTKQKLELISDELIILQMI